MSETPPTILVVDDEPQVRDLTCRALSRAGLECEQAEDGEQGFHKASHKSYSAVLTDLRMPHRHGHAFCNDLLKLPSPPPVMVFTALSDVRIVRDLMSRGVYDVVQKPVDYDLLATKVVMMVEQAKHVPTRPTQASKPTAASVSKLNLLHQIETNLSELTERFGERLDTVFEWSEELPAPPKAVRECIRRLAENERLESGGSLSSPLANEERRRQRVPCYTTAVAVPVNRQWKPVCQPFKLAVRDLSENGVRLLHTRAPNADFLAMQWNATQLPAKQLRIVTKVMRVKPLSPFYDIGGQFVTTE